MSRRYNQHRSARVLAISAAGISLLAAAMLPQAGRAQVMDPALKKYWDRLDYPVDVGKANRSWTWGSPLGEKTEPMKESPGGQRTVLYWEKSRMEINDPNADTSSPWYVTNGLLVTEMLSGKIQTGADLFEQRQPAQVLVAGEAPPNMGAANLTPTFATLGRVASLIPGQNVARPRTGQEVKEVLDASGSVAPGPLPGLQSFPKILYYEPVTGHNIPGVFWDFMNQRGIVYEDDQFKEDQLYNWVYVMGYPVTEPYWVRTYVKGQPASIMVQAFQRRLLTYNPANQAGWQVEMGNIGTEYYTWRYGEVPTPVGSGGSATPMNTRSIGQLGPLASRQYSAIHDPLYEAITDNATWQDLWTRHTAIFDQAEKTPQIDFSREFVVVAYWGDKPNGCYKLDIQSVEATGSGVTVTVNQQERKGACPQVITQPYDMLAVSRDGLTAGKHSVTFADTSGTTIASGEMQLP